MELRRFSVRPAGPGALLEWETATEHNNAGAAVNVHTLQANTQLLRHGQNTECKAFADFKEINRARFPSSLGQ